MNYLATKLPTDIRLQIDMFNSDHRDMMREVFGEMSDYFTLTWCDNDQCEANISRETAVTRHILGSLCYFCDDDCAGEGEWSIRYDYRKAGLLRSGSGL